MSDCVVQALGYAEGADSVIKKIGKTFAELAPRPSQPSARAAVTSSPLVPPRAAETSSVSLQATPSHAIGASPCGSRREPAAPRSAGNGRRKRGVSVGN